VLVAPGREHLSLAFGSSVRPGDPHDVPHAKYPELADLTGGLIFERKSTADELTIFGTWRVDKDCDLRRDPLLNKVGSFERPSAAGIKGDDDDVGGRDRFTNDESPSRGPQDRLAHGGNTYDDSRD
jgi:hypothetical protein